MKNDCRFQKRKKVLNVVELGQGELVYIRLDDGKKYLLNGSGCWRCGSTANCFGNLTDDDKLDIICEFDFYDEVRSLFLCLLQDRVTKAASWLNEKVHENTQKLIERFLNICIMLIAELNAKRTCQYTMHISN